MKSTKRKTAKRRGNPWLEAKQMAQDELVSSFAVSGRRYSGAPTDCKGGDTRVATQVAGFDPYAHEPAWTDPAKLDEEYPPLKPLRTRPVAGGFNVKTLAGVRLGIAPGYETLAAVHDDALHQAQAGKGKDRHSSGEPFEDQPIVSICESMGSPQFAIGQAHKKSRESLRLPYDRARAELLGAINYLSAAVIVLDRAHKKTPSDRLREVASNVTDPDTSLLAVSPDVKAKK